jgi:hypothetical protein
MQSMTSYINQPAGRRIDLAIHARPQRLVNHPQQRAEQRKS